MIDSRGRNIDYMRISVTDRCNLRCRYCMPEEGVERMRHEDILTYDEITRLVRIGEGLGIRKIKLTGGEPLVRKNVDVLVEQLTKMPGVEDVTMTCNGCLLGDMAKRLREAGLSSVNISMDTLDPERFFRITRKDCFAQAMDGVDRAIESGLKVKINCAVMEDLQEEDVLKFAELSREKGIPVRFIEMMPIGQGKNFKTLENDKLLKVLSGAYEDFKLDHRVRGNGPAVYYTFGEGHGCVGFISAVHHKFCESCNRVRLSSDGFLKLCLDSPMGVDLRTPLRNGTSDEEIRDLMSEWILKKPESHHFEEKREESGFHMNRIGG